MGSGEEVGVGRRWEWGGGGSGEEVGVGRMWEWGGEDVGVGRR